MNNLEFWETYDEYLHRLNTNAMQKSLQWFTSSWFSPNACNALTLNYEWGQNFKIEDGQWKSKFSKSQQLRFLNKPQHNL